MENFKLFRATESLEKREERLTNMVKRNKKIRAEESPNSKIVRQELDRKRKTDMFANESVEKKKLRQEADARRKREKRKSQKNSKEAKTISKEDIAPLVEVPKQRVKQSNPLVQDPEPKISEYEKIRLRNIAEREKLFQDLKLAELKAKASHA